MSFRLYNRAGWIGLNLLVACGFGATQAADQSAATPPASVTGITEAEIARARLQKEAAVRQAQLHVEQGRQLMKARRFEEALEQFVLATNLDPANPDAAAGRTEARRYLESRPSVGNNAAQVVKEEKVRQELGLAEINQQLAIAQKFYSDAAVPLDNLADKAKVQQISDSQKKLTDAQNAALRAKQAAENLPATVRPEERDRLLNQSVQLQINIKTLQASLQQQLEAISRSIAMNDANKEKQEVTRIESDRRQTLLKSAKTSMAKRRYEDAFASLNELLRLNPADKEAKDLKAVCEQQNIDYRNTVVDDLVSESRQVAMENIERAAITIVSPRNPVKFPADWESLVRQKQINRSTDVVSAAVQATRRKFENSYTFEFVETEFNLILDTIRNSTGLNIVVDKTVSGTPVMSEQLTFSFRNMRLDNIFIWIMRQTKLRYEISDTGIVNILSKESEAKDKTFEIIDIRDIAFAITNAKKMPEDDDDDDDDSTKDNEKNEAADTVTLGEVLTKFINKGASGEEPQIEVTEDGQLMMNASEEIRTQIMKLLEQLRSAQTIQVSVSARFLSLQDNFWEQFRSEFMDWAGNNTTSTSQNPNLYTSTTAVPTFSGSQTTGYANGTGSMPQTTNYYQQALGSFYYGNFSGLNSVFGAESNQNSTAMSAGGLTAQLQQLGFLGDLQTQWFIQMIRQTDRADELFCPQLVVYNNRYGWIKFTNRYPYISTYQEGDGSTGLVPVLAYIDEGCSLQVRPNISADRKYITVDVRPRVIKIQNKRNSNTGFTYTVGTGTTNYGYTIELPQVFRHDSKTYAIIPDGGAIMITGLSTNVNTQGRQGVPLLQDLPLLGNAFSSRYYQKNKRSYACLVNARMIILDEEEARASKR